MPINLPGILIILLATSLTSTQTLSKINAAATLATDYSHRGISQTVDDISAQGLLEYEFANGWYAGIWLGNLDFDRPGDRDFELDYFLGYSKRLNAKFAYDLTAIRYTYPGQNHGRNYDWQEFIASAYLGDRWLISVGVTDNWLAQDEQTFFAEVGYRHPLVLGLNLDASIGWQALAEPLPNYGYAELGISRGLGPVDLRVAYAMTEDKAKQRFGTLANNRWVASITCSL